MGRLLIDDTCILSRVCCNLVCLTQAVRCRLSPAKGVSCGDVLFRSLPNCPKVLKGLLEASGSLLINIWVSLTHTHDIYIWPLITIARD